MSSHDVKHLLDQVPDNRELVLRRQPTPSAAHDAWAEAREEAREAYRRWRAAATLEAYAVYRAAQDREDAAQDTLARSRSAAVTGARGRAPAAPK